MIAYMLVATCHRFINIGNYNSIVAILFNMHETHAFFKSLR